MPDWWGAACIIWSFYRTSFLKTFKFDRRLLRSTPRSNRENEASCRAQPENP